MAGYSELIFLLCFRCISSKRKVCSLWLAT